MASLGHVAIGIAAGRLHGRSGARAGALMVGFSALSLLPDADVISFTLGIPYSHELGHRGASHSLLAAVAMGLVMLLWPARDRRERLRAGVLGVLVAVSHGLLDALTDGGLGAALLWPWSEARIFAPWRPIPVAPIGSGMLSTRGLYVLAIEAVWFAPLLVYGLWPRRTAGAPHG